ncbi:MAG: twin transmembrane helix small protein [Rhodobacteraceae bacterium]|nr:MAG: twin transmembrane helix small protein [Paracoccaceae bacterium]
MESTLFFLVVFTCLTVLIVLMVGIGGFSRGGNFNKKYANKIMRLRIILQAIAIMLILIFVYFNKG